MCAHFHSYNSHLILSDHLSVSLKNVSVVQLDGMFLDIHSVHFSLEVEVNL